MAYLHSEKRERIIGANPYRVTIIIGEKTLKRDYRATLDGAYSAAYNRVSNLWDSGENNTITVKIEKRIGESRHYEHKETITLCPGELPIH